MAFANAARGSSGADVRLTSGPPARRLVAIEPNATLVDRQDLTSTMSRLRVRPDDGVPTFRAGQYFAIGLPVDGRFVQRPYSTASAPGEPGDLDFLVRLVPTGSLTPTLWRLRPGDRVRMGPPKGLFTLDADDPRRHVFLSTGTGIAPFLSMIGSLLRRPRASTAQGEHGGAPIVVHGVATAPELAYRGRLDRLARDGAIVYVPSVTRPDHPANHGWQGQVGRLDALVGSIVEHASLEPSGTVAYLCGNPQMITAVESRLATLGFPAEAVRAEQYWAPPALVAP